MSVSRYFVVLLVVALSSVTATWQQLVALLVLALIASIDGWVEAWRTRTINVNVGEIRLRTDGGPTDTTAKP